MKIVTYTHKHGNDVAAFYGVDAEARAHRWVGSVVLENSSELDGDAERKVLGELAAGRWWKAAKAWSDYRDDEHFEIDDFCEDVNFTLTDRELMAQAQERLSNVIKDQESDVSAVDPTSRWVVVHCDWDGTDVAYAASQVQAEMIAVDKISDFLRETRSEELRTKFGTAVKAGEWAAAIEVWRSWQEERSPMVTLDIFEFSDEKLTHLDAEVVQGMTESLLLRLEKQVVDADDADDAEGES